MGFRHVARGFDQVTALASEGKDVAILYAEASGTNIYTRNGVLETLHDASFVTAVASFDRVTVVGNTEGASGDPASGSPGATAISPAVSVAYVSGDMGLKSQLVTGREESTTSLAHAAESAPADVTSAGEFSGAEFVLDVAGVDTAIRQDSLARRTTEAEPWVTLSESDSLAAATCVFEMFEGECH